MSSDARKYLQALGAGLAEALGPGYRFHKSALELRAATDAGENLVTLGGAMRHSPLVDVAFHFGCSYGAAKAVAKQLGLQAGPHIVQYSLNRASMKGLPMSGPGRGSWSVHIGTPPDATLLAEIATAIRGMAAPFFERFAGMAAARDAVAADDSWCLGGRMQWRSVLALDAALGELDHFRAWAARLDPLNAQEAHGLLLRAEALRG
jgi:hypothetical protein